MQPTPAAPLNSGDIGVLVVDDNDILGEAFERWLGRAEGMRCVGWTHRFDEAERLVAERKPDVLLLDVDIPGCDTFALMRSIASRHSVKVVMISGHMRQDYLDRALDAGAAGYIVKDESPSAILEYVRRVAAGELVLSTTAQDWARGQR